MNSLFNEKENCCGCGACENICPKNAISLNEDEFGYVFPKINSTKCINCNLCKKVCPISNMPKVKYPQKCFAAYAKDKHIHESSTSGGIAAVFSKHVINQSGVVYGAAYCNDTVKHIRVDNFADLKKLQGSKYVQSYILSTFKNVKNDLNNGKTVLFTGTPCQVAGLKNFLQKDYDNLFTADVICHGVPSQKYLKDEIGTGFTNVSFRSKNDFILKTFKNEKNVNETQMTDSDFYSSFIFGMFYRESCYKCRFAKPERVSDITIGDFWGLGNDSRLLNDNENGISVVLPITNKGIKLFNNCKEDLIFEERSIEEAVNGNSQLKHPFQKPRSYKKFQKIYLRKGLAVAYKKTNPLRILKRKAKNNKFIYNVYKAIKGKSN